MLYQICAASGNGELRDVVANVTQRVNVFLAQGWEPQGGVSVAVTINWQGLPDHYYAAQALIQRTTPSLQSMRDAIAAGNETDTA